MKTRRLAIARGVPSLLGLVLLVACGGGGGGGGDGGPDPVVYTGNTAPALVTAANASKLTSAVIGTSDAAQILGGVSTEGGDATQDRGTGLIDLARRLNRNFRGIVVRMEQMRSAQRAASAASINDTENCAGGGTIRTSGTLDDSTGTGTVSVAFNSCVLDGVTVNGPATMRIDAFLPNPIPTDFTFSFVRLTFRGPSLNVDAGGSLRMELVLFPITETVTASLVSLDNSTGGMTKSENLRIENVMTSGTSFTANISGRVSDQVHGYVDITTPILLVFDTATQSYPNGGQMLLVGDGNRSVRVTALGVPPATAPATLAMLELDTDGVGGVDVTATLKWTDLSGPVGADLADDDSDGMHNSWETVNGLDPIVDDAALDKDNDLATNLAEYLAGTDPSDPGSQP